MFSSLSSPPSALLLSAALALGLGVSGCTATSKYMAPAPVPAAAPAAAPGVATLAFFRTSMLGSAITFMIIDQNGHFVGESTAGASFVVTVPPGEYLFIAEGENTAVMHANIAADHLYYVRINPKMGVFGARVGLEPIKPGSEDWPKLPEMLQGTTRFVPLPAQGQAALDATPEVIKKRIANAQKKWAEYSPDERSKNNLDVGDGVGDSAPVAQPGPAPAAQPAAAAPAT